MKLRADKAWNHFLTLPGFRKYFTNTSWLMAEKVFRSVMLLVIGVCVARYLGPERFGLLSYAISFVALFSALGTLGLDGIVVRELVKDEARRNQLLGTAFFLKLTGAFLVLVISYVAVSFTSNDGFTNLLIFIIALSTVFQSFNVIDFYLQSIVLSKYVVYAKAASLVIWSLVSLVLIFTQASLLYFAVVFLIERAVLAAGLGVVYVSRKLSIFEWRPRFKTAVELLKDSWPLVLSGIAVSIYMKIDQVMIKQILDTKAVGQYAAAVKISEAWYFVPVIICGSLFPAIVNAKKQSEEQYNSRLQKLYGLMVWIALPITIVITFAAGGIVRLLYGTEFSEAASVLIVHIWASVFVFLGVASSKWFLAENLQLYSFLYKGSGALINVILNFILLRRFGIVGAAWATVISYGCAAFFLNLFCVKTRSNFYLMCRSFNILRFVFLLGR